MWLLPTENSSSFIIIAIIQFFFFLLGDAVQHVVGCLRVFSLLKSCRILREVTETVIAERVRLSCFVQCGPSPFRRVTTSRTTAEHVVTALARQKLQNRSDDDGVTNAEQAQAYIQLP